MNVANVQLVPLLMDMLRNKTTRTRCRAKLWHAILWHAIIFLMTLFVVPLMRVVLFFVLTSFTCCRNTETLWANVYTLVYTLFGNACMPMCVGMESFTQPAHRFSGIKLQSVAIQFLSLWYAAMYRRCTIP